MKLKFYLCSRNAVRLLFTTAALLSASFAFAQPTNDECSGATGVVPSATTTCSPVSSSSSGATYGGTDPSCSSIPTGDVWYSFVAAGPAYAVSLSNVLPTNPNTTTFYSYGVAVYSGTCGSLNEMDCTIGINSVFGDVAAALTLNGLSSGTTYYVRVWADESYNGSFDPEATDIDFDLCIAVAPPPPANDLCTGAILLTQGGPATGDNSNASNDALGSLPACGSSSSGAYKGVWYKATPTASGNLTVASCGSSFDTYLRVFSGGDCGAFTTCVGYNDDGCSPQSTLTFAATANTTYYILLAGYGDGDAGTFTIAATGVALPVTMDQLSGAITAGNLAQLSWNTFSEQNNRGFEIQRSADGKLFTAAGFVASKAVQGNSREQQRYTFTDPETVTGTVYYRLLQTDIDNKTNYSNTIQLSTGAASGFSLVAGPNPVKDKLHIKILGQAAAAAQLSITDLSGKTVYRSGVQTESLEIDLGMLNSGLYLLKYTDALHTQTLKIQKQ